MNSHRCRPDPISTQVVGRADVSLDEASELARAADARAEDVRAIVVDDGRIAWDSTPAEAVPGSVDSDEAVTTNLSTRGPGDSGQGGQR